MKKLVLLALCCAIAYFGGAYIQGTLALSDPEQAAQGISIAFADRTGAPVQGLTLVPAYARDFNPQTDKETFQIPNGPALSLWNDKLSGAQDHLLLVTNQGQTPCFFRAYLAFENNGGVFTDHIRVNWNADLYDITQLAQSAQLNDGSLYSVYAVTCRRALPAGQTADPALLQLYLTGDATAADLQALAAPGGSGYAIKAAAEAVWQPGENAADAGEIAFFSDYTVLDHPQIGMQATLERAMALLNQ